MRKKLLIAIAALLTFGLSTPLYAQDTKTAAAEPTVKTDEASEIKADYAKARKDIKFKKSGRKHMASKKRCLAKDSLCAADSVCRRDMRAAKCAKSRRIRCAADSSRCKNYTTDCKGKPADCKGKPADCKGVAPGCKQPCDTSCTARPCGRGDKAIRHGGHRHHGRHHHGMRPDNCRKACPNATDTISK